MLVTSGIGWNPFANVVYGEKDITNFTLEVIGGGGASPQLGASETVTSGETLDQGWWLLIDASGTPLLINSDGTTTAPSSGTGYPMSF